MRRALIALALALVVVSTAAAATVRGTKKADLLAAAFGATDTVTCGAGRDVVTADAVDRVAADCEVVSRRLSVDPYANGDSQHETAVEPDDLAFGGTVVAAFQIGRREQGAASNIGTAVSTDQGRTWRRALLPGLTVNAGGGETAASDPSVAYDDVHGVWLVSSLTIHPGGSHVFVSRSNDGLHWAAPVDVASGSILDKEWLVCDNGAASPFRGRCYAEYTDDQKNTTVSQSSDDGGATWSTPVRAGPVLVGTQPVVQANGTLTVVAGDYRGEGLQGSIVALRSTDGGATFQRFPVSDLRADDNDPMRAIALPSVDVDSDGTMYAAWHDCRFRSGCAGNDIVLSQSKDGATWTTPIRITSGPSSFIPGLGADPSRPGHLALVSAYFHVGGTTLGVALRQSRDGGRTWSAPQRLDTQPMPMSWLPRSEGGRMVGDYFSVAYVADRVVPVFTLATSPRGSRFREAIFATSVKALG